MAHRGLRPSQPFVSSRTFAAKNSFLKSTHGAGQVPGVERLLQHFGIPHGLDADVGAVAPGEALDRPDHILAGGVDHIGGPELAGQLELARIGGRWPRWSRRQTAEHRRWPHTHAAAAEHRHRVPRPDLTGQHGRAQAGHHPTTQQTDRLGPGGRVHFGALARGHQRLFGKGPDAQRRREGCPVGECHLLARR